MYKRQRQEEAPKIHLWSEEKQGITSLHIRDNGGGIAPEDLPRVFEKSFTGKNGRTGQASTGIGLYLCKKLSQRLGHRLEIESEEGCYTEVILSFEQDAHMTF